jgi:hypothetical protein
VRGKYIDTIMHGATIKDCPLVLSNYVICGQNVREKQNVQNTSELKCQFETVSTFRPN